MRSRGNGAERGVRRSTGTVRGRHGAPAAVAARVGGSALAVGAAASVLNYLTAVSSAAASVAFGVMGSGVLALLLAAVLATTGRVRRARHGRSGHIN